MKRFTEWRVWIAQLHIVIAFVLLGALVFYCLADYNFAAIESYIRQRFHGWFLVFVIGWLLSSVYFLMVGVRYLQEFINERENFIHAAMHDLRTPVAGLKLLIGRNDRAAAVAVERMRLMIENLNDFLNCGKLRPPHPERFDVVSAYREAYELLAEDFAETESGAVEVSGAGREMFVVADRTQVMQIIWNLLGNELKYAAPYGKVSVTFTVADDMVSVRFADLGPGMSRRERARAFDRYYRARTIRLSGKGGFGIGLCSAREAARANGGDIVLQTNRPRGCVFTLCLKAS